MNALGAMSGVHVLRGRKVEFRDGSGQPIDVQIDGEYAGVAPGSIEIAPERLRLMLPRAFLRRMAS